MIPIIEKFIKSKVQKGEHIITEEEAKILAKMMMDETEIILKGINRELKKLNLM